MGQTIKAGTGMCDILLDERKLVEEMQSVNLTTDDFIQVTDNNITTLLHDTEEEHEYDAYCSDENFDLTGF